MYTLAFSGGKDIIFPLPAFPRLSSFDGLCTAAAEAPLPWGGGKGPGWNAEPPEGGLPQRTGKIPGAFYWPPQECPAPLVFQYT